MLRFVLKLFAHNCSPPFASTVCRILEAHSTSSECLLKVFKGVRSEQHPRRELGECLRSVPGASHAAGCHFAVLYRARQAVQYVCACFHIWRGKGSSLLGLGDSHA